jgi:transposase
LRNAKILAVSSIAEAENLWTFVYHEGVEPTNNLAERAARHPVIWRRISHVTQSEKGSLFVERILTVHATCNQPSRNTFSNLFDACVARLNHQPAPSLLPSSA